MTQTIDILHVDDDPGFAEIVADFLEHENDQYTLQIATSASEALNQLAEGHFDCVVSEYDMPGRNGIDLLNTVREESPNLPFILYTGEGSEEVASEAISAGVTDYLEKETGTSQYSLLANQIENAVRQHKTQQQLQESERWFDAIFEDPKMLVGILDPDGTLRKTNQTAMEYIDADHDAVTGELFWETPWWNDEIRSDVKGWVKQSTEGEYVAFEAGLNDADGNEYYVEGHIRPVTTTKGKIASLVVSVRDITERKEQKLKLRIRSAAMEESIDGMAILDANERYTFVNRAHADVYGYDDPDAFLENSWRMCYDEDEIDQLEKEVLPELSGTGSWRGEVEGKRRDGTTFPQELSLTKLDDGSIICVVRDITERKKRERELKRFKTTLDTLPDSVSIYDRNLDCIYVNQALVDESGVPRDDYIGTSMETILGSFPKEEAQEWIETMETLLSGEQVRAGKTLEFPNDLETLHIDTRASRIESETEGVIGVVNVLRDITERVEARQELKRQNKYLENFGSIVSHDLRNPLTVAEGNLDLAREKYDSEYLKTVADAHNRMSALIEDLLMLARQGATIDEAEPVDLATLSETSWETSKTAGGTLKVSTEETIRADESRAQQLLENLFRNAVEHAGEDVTVTVGDLRDKKGFYVADDGPGISPHEREQVFDVGYSTAENGTGYGLKIVEEIATAHGWDITVTDSDSAGTRFEITGVEFVAE